MRSGHKGSRSLLMVTEYIKQGVAVGTFQVATYLCVCVFFFLASSWFT